MTDKDSKSSQAPPSKPESRSIVRKTLPFFYAIPVVFVLGLLGVMAYYHFSHKQLPVRVVSAIPFATMKVGGMEARLFSQGSALHAAGNDLLIEFRDSHGNLTDVGQVSIMLVLKMDNQIRHSIGKVMPTSTPGQYRTALEPAVAGDWIMTLGFTGPRGQAEANLPVKVL